MLEIEDVSAGYGETKVLHGVSLNVPEHTTVALLGPNGAGKTTLLRVASGLMRPTGGFRRLDGEDVTKERAYKLVGRGVCHIPEGRGIFPNLTVRENLVVDASRGGEKAAVARAADTFPILAERLNQPAGNLSGGQQQMLALMRAYVQHPRYLLVDEPSTGLAPVLVDEIFAFLRDVAREGTALLLVEQYVSKALAIADTVYILNRGTVAFTGTPDELRNHDIFTSYLGGELEMESFESVPPGAE